MTGFGEVNMVLALSLLLTAGFALARLAKALAWVSSGEVAGSFVLTGVAVGLTAWLTGMGGEDGGTGMWVATALVAAAIAVATAPAATVAVIRECEASGPVTRLVLSSVVVNNALSVTLFGLAVAAARALLGTHEGGGGDRSSGADAQRGGIAGAGDSRRPGVRLGGA